MMEPEVFAIVIWALLWATIFAPLIFRIVLKRYADKHLTTAMLPPEEHVNEMRKLKDRYMEELATCQNFTSFMKHVAWVTQVLNHPDTPEMQLLAEALRASVELGDADIQHFETKDFGVKRSMDKPIRRKNSLRRSSTVDSIESGAKVAPTPPANVNTQVSATKPAPEPDQVGKPFLDYEDDSEKGDVVVAPDRRSPTPTDRRSRETPEPPNMIVSETSDL